VVDIDHGTSKSSSFTRSVKDVETAVKSPYDLIRRVFTFRLPAKVEAQKQTGLLNSEVVRFPMAAIPSWLDNRTRSSWPDPKLYRLPECRALLKAAGPGGGPLEPNRFRRVADGNESTWLWEVQIRQLILAADGTKVSRALPGEAITPKYHVVIPKPRRRVAVAAVARTLHYPEGLIDPHVPVDRMVDYLPIRRDLRLIANYGRSSTRCSP
jgi:hypothetical protein